MVQTRPSSGRKRRGYFGLFDTCRTRRYNSCDRHLQNTHIHTHAKTDTFKVSHTLRRPLLETLLQSLLYNYSLCVRFCQFLGFRFVSLNIHRFPQLGLADCALTHPKSHRFSRSRNAPVQDHEEENVDVLQLISLPNNLVFIRNGRYVQDHNRTHRTQHQRSSTQAPFPHTLLLVRTHDSPPWF